MGAILSANASKVQGLATENGYRLSWAAMGLTCLVAAVVATGFVISGHRQKAAPVQETAPPVAP